MTNCDISYVGLTKLPFSEDDDVESELELFIEGFLDSVSVSTLR